MSIKNARLSEAGCGSQLVCPVCDDDYSNLHQGQVRVEDAKDLIAIEFSCEGCSNTKKTLTISQSKGTTSLTWFLR